MDNKITISILVGSIRDGRQGDYVVNWVAEFLRKEGFVVYLIDPNEHKWLQTLILPYHYNKSPTKEMTQVHNQLLESDGFVLITPEYNHSFSGTIKNVIDNFLPEYEKKPFGIVSYSYRASGGVNANDALRVIVAELKGVPTPISIWLGQVQDTFTSEGKLKNLEYEKKIAMFADNFLWYVRALRDARIKDNKKI